MPEAKLTELEHFQLTAKVMELQAIEEKGARMMEMRKNAELTLEVTARELNSIQTEKAAAILLRTSIFEKIGKRVKATGSVDTWEANMDHKNPKNSKLIWPEKENEGSGENPK